jgi:hypothetical protein
MNIFNYLRLKHHIKRQLRLCTKYPQYRSAIYVSSVCKITTIIKIINAIINHKPAYKALLHKENQRLVSNSISYYEWYFRNRSRINCVYTEGVSLNHRLHSMIVDTDVPKDVKDSVIAPTIVFYQTKKKPSRIDMVKDNKYGYYLVRNYWTEIPIKITARDTLEATTERRS